MARPPRLSLAEFERLVEKAIEQLPAEFQGRLENVVIAVEDEPSDEDYELTNTPDDEELFGIYRGPILRNTQNSGEAVKEIKDTLVHELGHYFGLEDDEMPY